jgi:uncharacterized protein YndB with AHSA1/START domain
MAEPDAAVKGLPPGAHEVVREVVVRAPRAKAWRSFTRGIMEWWPAGFATRKDARMVLDARLGGSLREDWGRGGGLRWYTVESVDPGRRILLHGDIGAPFGGPARTHVEVTFEDAPGGTRVRLRDVVFAGATESLRAALDSGWRVVLEESFAAHFEAAPAKPRRAKRR